MFFVEDYIHHRVAVSYSVEKWVHFSPREVRFTEGNLATEMPDSCPKYPSV